MVRRESAAIFGAILASGGIQSGLTTVTTPFFRLLRLCFHTNTVQYMTGDEVTATTQSMDMYCTVITSYVPEPTRQRRQVPPSPSSHHSTGVWYFPLSIGLLAPGNFWFSGHNSRPTLTY